MASKETIENYNMQRDLQREEIEGNQTAYAPQLQERVQETQAVLVDQTNPKRVVKEIMLRLQGKEERPDGSTVQIAEPKLNKKGIDNIWFILDSHINQNVILSHLDEKEITKIMEQVGKDLVRDISLNANSYGIIKKTDKDIINNSILINIFLALKRAEGQNEKNWLGKISVENISSSTRLPPVKKESWWGKFRV